MPNIKTNTPIPYIPKSEQKPRKRHIKTLAKLSIVLALIASLGSNYLLLKAHYNFKCSVGGYAISKEKCHALATMQEELTFANAEIGRLEMTAINADILN